MSIISVCCDPRECVFSYKRWENLPDDLDNPDIVFKSALPTDTLHVSDYGFVLVGGAKVYSPYSAVPHLESLPPLPDSDAKWLWISDNGSPSTSADSVFLYAAKATVEEIAEGGDLGTILRVWKWDEATDITTLIIEHTYNILPAATTATNYYIGDGGAILPGNYHLAATQTAGSFEGLSSKLGDIRHGRIVIVGNAGWYDEGSNSEYEHNSTVSCWDTDGLYKWSAQLADVWPTIYVKVWDDRFDPPWGTSPFGGTPYFIGFPKPIRLRIGEDKSVTVLTTPSRTPEQYGFKWSTYYGRDDNGAAVHTCVWRISDDVTAAFPLSSSNWALYGKYNGVTYTVLSKAYHEDGEDAVGGPILDVHYNATAEQFELSWTPLATGDPADYFFRINGADGGPYDVPATQTTYIDSLSDPTVSRLYRVNLHLVADGSLVGTGSGYSITYGPITTRLSSPRDMDVTAIGNVFLSLKMNAGHGLAKIIYDPTPFLFDDSDTNPDGYRGVRYEEDSTFAYNEGSREYAGPIWVDSYGDNYPEPAPPQSGDGDDVWVLRSGVNGTYLVRIRLINLPTDPYEVNRIWSCSYHPELRLERAKHEPADASTFPGDLHSSVVGGVVVEPDSPCPPCDPPVDDPCSQCEDKTRKVAWELLDSPLKDNDAAVQHFNTIFMKCQNLGAGQPAGLWYYPGGPYYSAGFYNLNSFDGCAANYVPYLNWPIRYTPGVDCAWTLCSPYNIKICQVGFLDDGTPPTMVVTCTQSGTPLSEMFFFVSQFVLRFWIEYIDPMTGDHFGPSTLAEYWAEDPEQICGPEARFVKVIDNSNGPVPGLPYHNQPYFRDVIRAKRVPEGTPCDTPEIPEPEPWCPGVVGVDPPEFFEVGNTFLGNDGALYEYHPEPSPNLLEYQGGGVWTMPGTQSYNYSFTLDDQSVEGDNVWNCGQHFFSYTLTCSDINDPDATWSLSVNYSGLGGPGTDTFPITMSCPPLAGSVDYSSTFQCNAGYTTWTIGLSIYNPPSPAMPSRIGGPSPKLISAKKKTPEDVPCVHRGGYLKTVSCCGDIYQCKKKEVYQITGQRACAINPNRAGFAACSVCKFRE